MTEFLFDDIDRSPLCFENMPESSFQCLNQFDWPDGVRIRRDLEVWFKRFPHSAHKDLQGRFQSKDNHQHEGAFFELFLHELVTRLVLQPHSCWPKTERARRGAEVTAFGPFMQFRGCSKCAFAPSFSPEKLQIRELRL